jgi:hypothetical protein
MALALPGMYRTPRSASGTSATMIKALKIRRRGSLWSGYASASHFRPLLDTSPHASYPTTEPETRQAVFTRPIRGAAQNSRYFYTGTDGIPVLMYLRSVLPR